MAAEDPPKYINFAKLAHTQNEFFLDLASLYPALDGEPQKPGTANGQLVGRFVMSPSHAKAVMSALVENVSRYEAQYGDIDLPDAQPQATLN